MSASDPEPQSASDLEEALFLAAVHLTGPFRVAFCIQASAHDAGLRQRLEERLARHEASPRAPGSERPAGEPKGQSQTQGHGPTQICPPPEEAIGTALGRYKLRERIGEGGWGTVYVAEQAEPVRRRVALKVIKLGMDTREVIARFEAERQALAMMDHANIAKVLDAGATESGRPYFVMELVHGIRITDYCAQNKLLTEERLNLFIQVCHAIQHAHQKGIIHRDIKPSNILVTLNDGVPLPKVIDFGIAKATQGRLTDVTIYTELHQFIGTPAYMSPEQAEISGLDIDTRSDIYSLGVLLYELLTSKTPFDGRELRVMGIDAMRRIIREEEPVKPSTRLTQNRKNRTFERESKIQNLKPKIPQDLDWIVMKCLEKDRTRRYDTANGLALDLKRHLDNEPVLACPPSTVYRLQKAWRRNRILYSAVGTVVASLVAGMSVSLWQARQAMRAKSQALESQHAEREQRLTAVRESANAVRARELAEQERNRADQEAGHARQSAYVSDMNLVAQAWETGNLLGARDLLSRYHPQSSRTDLPGFEWRLLWGLAHEDKTKFHFNAGSNAVDALAVSPDGRWLAWCGADSRVRIVDVEARHEKFVLPGHSSRITSLAFSADRHWLASGGNDGLIGIWDVPSWTLKSSLQGHVGNVRTLSFNPDGTKLVSTAADATVRIWDLANLAQERVFQSPENSPDLSVSPDGKLLATFGGLNNAPRFWSLGSEIRQLPTLPPQQGIILSVTFGSRGKSAIISGHNSRVTNWELDPLKPGVTYWQKVLVGQVALSANGNILATGGNDNLVKVWRAASGQELRVLRGHTAALSHLALSADGKTLVSADISNEVKVWATDPVEDANVFTQDGIVVHVAASPEGEMLATSDPNFFTARLWNLQTQVPTPFATNGKAHVIFSPNGKWLAVGRFTGPVELWERTSKPYQKVQVIKGDLTGVGYHLNFSPDSRILAFRAAGDIVELWDIAAQRSLGHLPNHSSGECGTAFSSDGELIATGSDKQIRLWHVRSQQLLATIGGQHRSIRSVCFSPDARVLAAASGNTEVRRWNISNPKDPQPLPPFTGHTAFVPQIAFSPDGKTLATASFDSTLRLWDAALGQEMAILRGHSAVVQCLTWSGDGQALFTGSGDATVRIWRAPSWETIAAAEAKEKAEFYQP